MFLEFWNDVIATMTSDSKPNLAPAIAQLKARRPDLFAAPAFWRSRLGDIAVAAEQCSVARPRTLGRSEGGRPIVAFESGHFEPQRPTTTISSAASSDRPQSFFDPALRTRPALVLVGCIHGGETQGIAVSMNVLSVIERGRDLLDRPQPELEALLKHVRLVIVPCMNPDGRERAGVDHLIAAGLDDLFLVQQGLDGRGELLRGRRIKELQPFPPEHQFLGGYYNDAGINLQHDDFFGPSIASENAAMRDLMRAEMPDGFLTLHAHASAATMLAPDAFVSPAVQRRQAEVNGFVSAALLAKGFAVHHADRSASPPWTFNFQCFHHHVAGSTPSLLELPQGLNNALCTLTDIVDVGLVAIGAWIRHAVAFGLRPGDGGFYPTPVRA